MRSFVFMTHLHYGYSVNFIPEGSSRSHGIDSSLAIYHVALTHLCQYSVHKWNLFKQCTPRSDATERNVISVFTLFLLSTVNIYCRWLEGQLSRVRYKEPTSQNAHMKDKPLIHFTSYRKIGNIGATVGNTVIEIKQFMWCKRPNVRCPSNKMDIMT